jgi:hypothetical protein
VAQVAVCSEIDKIINKVGSVQLLNVKPDGAPRNQRALKEAH